MKRQAPAHAWKPGQSGNPKGRPPGRGAVAELRDQLAQDMDKIIDVLRAQALSGDPVAIRVVLDRVLPALRPVEQPQPLALPEGASLTDSGRAVLAAVAAGELAPGQGAQLLAAIGTLGRIAEMDELAARVAALEERRDAKP